jgi:xyloglucan:xyloglucosyl transferase
MGVNMAKFEKMLAAFFICAFIPNIIHVKANFSKSMYLTWGVQHASIIGEDLHLVLDKSSGDFFFFLACTGFGFNRFVSSNKM